MSETTDTAGSGETADTGATETTAAAAAADSGTEAAAGEAKQSFTQRQLDDMVRYRVKKKDQELADLQAKLQEFEDAKKSDLEKAQAQVKKLEREASDASKRAQESALRAAVVAEAARKNVIDPDAAFALLDRATLELDDAGSPTNIADAMDALLTAKPYLVQQAGRTPSADLGARGKNPGTEQLPREALTTMSPGEIVQAQKAGRFDDVLGRAR